MFDLSFSELLIVGLIALIVLGPKRLPEVARTAGSWVAKTRRFVAGVKQEFDRELQREELTELRKLQQELTEAKGLVEETTEEALKKASLDFEPEYLLKADTGTSPASEASPASSEQSEPPAKKKRRPRKRSTTTKRAPSRQKKQADGQEDDKPV